MEKDMQIKLECHSDSGSQWDDGAHQKIEKIIIGCIDDVIRSIQAVYRDEDGTRVLAPKHGGDFEAKSYSSYHVITKPITRIRGFSSADKYRNYAVSFLEFSNDEGICGSFGIKLMLSSSFVRFTFESDTGFTGLHGREECSKIKALGVYIKG